MIAIFIALIAFVATIFLIFLLRPVASVTGLVDTPNDRSSHRRPTPLIGGLAMFLGVVVAYSILVAMGQAVIDREIQSFFIASLLLVVVGVVDDFMHLSPLVRFVAQIAASLIMIYGAGIVVVDFGAMSFSGEVIELGWLAVPFTVFATLGIINALNMSDGIDGLSGSMTLISLSGLLVAAWLTGATLDKVFLIILAASTLGFLMFNLRIFRRSEASVFMGDAGSMFLGFSLTWFAISLSQWPDRSITPAAALWFLMLPIFDTVAMVFRRLVRRKSPFSPDKEHIHHVLMMAGFTINESVAIMAAAALIGVGIGVLSLDLRVPEFSVAGLFVVAGLLYLWMILRAWKVMQFIERSICRRNSKEDRRSNVERRSGDDSAYHDQERRSGTNRRIADRRRQIRTSEAISENTSDLVDTPALDIGRGND